MNKGIFNYYKPSVLVALIALLAIAVFIAKVFWSISISVISIISILLWVIDKWLWRTKMFSWMFWIEDFSGRYEGQLEFEYRDEKCIVHKGKLKHVKIIHQSGSKINIYSFTMKEDGEPSSLSVNKGMYVMKLEQTKHYQFLYSYLNDGDMSLSTHYGTEIIKYIKKGSEKYLSGRYFTERVPYSTKGKFIDLKWVNNNQNHEF